MTKYNTGNPVGSSDPRDLHDNAQNADYLENGSAPAYLDRLGVMRKSRAGMAKDFDDFLAASGYQFLGDYEAGIEVTAYNEVIRESGEFWRAAAETSLPHTTTGLGMPEGGAFLSVGDAVLRQNLGLPVSSGNGALLVNGATMHISSVAEDVFGLSVIDGKRIDAQEWHRGKNIGGHALTAKSDWPKSEHGVTGWSPTVPPVSAQAGANLAEKTANYLNAVGETDPGGTGGFVRSAVMQPLIEEFGAYPGTTASDSASEPLKKCREYVQSRGGGILCALPGKYIFTETFFYETGNIIILGSGENSTELHFIGASTAIAGAVDDLTTITRNGFGRLSLTGDETSGPDKVVDWTTMSYGTFRDFTIQSKKPNAILVYGQGNNGASPYYNTMENFALFGGPDYSQIGMQFDQGAWAGGSNGPNANSISNLRRAAVLKYIVDLKSGTGNHFNNIQGESIDTAYFNFNENPAVESGTATGGSSNTITGTFNQPVLNGAVKITGGTGAGQIRQVAVYSSGTLNVTPNWAIAPDATSTWETYEGKVSENNVVNLRAEGLASRNPDLIRVHPGTHGCSVKQATAQSLGNGLFVNDPQNDPSNSFSEGDLVYLNEIIENPGINANINLYPKTSVFGGARIGRSHIIEGMWVESHNFAGGSATITLDDGGVNVGEGTPSLQVTIDTNNRRVFVPVTQKVKSSTQNKGIYLNVQTDGSWNAAADLQIGVMVRSI